MARTKPEYKIIWEAPLDPVKVMKTLGKLYAAEHGLELEGVYNEKGEKVG